MVKESEWFWELIQIAIPNIITLGIVSKMINTELKKKKNEIQLKNLEKALELLAMSSRIVEEENNKMILSKVLELGSETSINIATEFKKKGLKINNFEELNYDFLAYYPILFCQIKFELTQIKVNPLSFYLLTFSNEYLTDVELEKYKKANNLVVKNLKLNDFLTIK